MKRKAFTLIELLVVIAIIAILAAILFPVFSQAREKARQATCLSYKKNIGTAWSMYAQDYDERLPLFVVFNVPGADGAPMSSCSLTAATAKSFPARRQGRGNFWLTPSTPLARQAMLRWLKSSATSKTINSHPTAD